MDPVSAAAVGGVAGLLGAALAHVLTAAAGRLGSDEWLRGPYGPQFVGVALYTAVFYGAIAWAARRRALTAAVGFLVPLLVVVMPMFVLTRYGGWGMPRESGITPQWRYAVLAVYIVAIWGAIAAIGAVEANGPRWRGALAAVVGSLVAYGALSAVQRLAPELLVEPKDPRSFLPPSVNLLDGLLSGAGLCLALSLEDLFLRRPS